MSDGGLYELEPEAAPRRGAPGPVMFDYGNNIRQRALDEGFADAFAFPGFVPAFIRPQFCLGRGPFRGTDVVSDWPLLNFAANVASGASWVSFHHGGGVGIGYSEHAGQVVVADGTPEAAARLERVLTNDPMMGIFRHADAGYEEAAGRAHRHRVEIPMLGD